MVFKLNISDKGKAWKLEVDGEILIGKSLGDKINGAELGNDFEGYELEITGGSDSSGFPMSKNAEGIGLRRVLLTKGWGMRDSRKGIRLRKTVRGRQLSDKAVQVNIRVLKEGKKKLSEIFPEQNKAKEKAEKSVVEDNKEKMRDEAVKEEKREDLKEEKIVENVGKDLE